MPPAATWLTAVFYLLFSHRKCGYDVNVSKTHNNCVQFPKSSCGEEMTFSRFGISESSCVDKMAPDIVKVAAESINVKQLY